MPEATDEAARLFAAVRRLAFETQEAAMGTPAYRQAQAVLAEMDAPLAILVMGRIKAGKSTLVNALVGSSLAPTGARLCTRTVNYYRGAQEAAVVVSLCNGDELSTPAEHLRAPLTPDLGQAAPAEVDRVTVSWPLPALRQMTLIDPPGLELWGSPDLAREFGAQPVGSAPAADAVLHLLGHLHATAPELAEDLDRDDMSGIASIGRVVILARADEMGGGQVGAMKTAQRIARRYRQDARVHRLCQSVLPLDGLLAFGAQQLTAEQYGALAMLAGLGDAARQELLESADRVAMSTLADPSSETRSAMVESLGLFGMRFAVEWIRVASQPDLDGLRQALLEESGWVELTATVSRLLLARREVLKAQATIQRLRLLLTNASMSGTRGLLTQIERVEAGAHAFRELRLLYSLSEGAIAMSQEEIAVAERLLGSPGEPLALRLGLEAEATAEATEQALYEMLGRWQSRAQDPVAPEEVRDGAMLLARTCEGLVVEMMAGRGAGNGREDLHSSPADPGQPGSQE